MIDIDSTHGRMFTHKPYSDPSNTLLLITGHCDNQYVTYIILITY
jgi:hypothetical protein